MASYEKIDRKVEGLVQNDNGRSYFIVQNLPNNAHIMVDVDSGKAVIASGSQYYKIREDASEKEAICWNNGSYAESISCFDMNEVKRHYMLSSEEVLRDFKLDVSYSKETGVLAVLAEDESYDGEHFGIDTKQELMVAFKRILEDMVEKNAEYLPCPSPQKGTSVTIVEDVKKEKAQTSYTAVDKPVKGFVKSSSGTPYFVMETFPVGTSLSALMVNTNTLEGVLASGIRSYEITSEKGTSECVIWNSGTYVENITDFDMSAIRQEFLPTKDFALHDFKAQITFEKDVLTVETDERFLCEITLADVNRDALLDELSRALSVFEVEQREVTVVLVPSHPVVSMDTVSFSDAKTFATQDLANRFMQGERVSDVHGNLVQCKPFEQVSLCYETIENSKNVKMNDLVDNRDALKTLTDSYKSMRKNGICSKQTLLDNKIPFFEEENGAFRLHHDEQGKEKGVASKSLKTKNNKPKDKER